MRLAEDQELEDGQEYCYVDILKYKTPSRIGAKVAGLQQSGSQSVTSIPLSEELHNMLFCAEDQKRDKEPQDFDRFKTAIVQAAANPLFVAPESWEDPGQTVCVGGSHSLAVREVCIAHFFFLGGSNQAVTGCPLLGILLRQQRCERYEEPAG